MFECAWKMGGKMWQCEEVYTFWSEPEWGAVIRRDRVRCVVIMSSGAMRITCVRPDRCEWVRCDVILSERVMMWVVLSWCEMECRALHVCEQSKFEKEVEDACPRCYELLGSDRVRACHGSINGKLRKIILNWSSGTQKEMRKWDSFPKIDSSAMSHHVSWSLLRHRKQRSKADDDSSHVTWHATNEVNM